MSLWFSLLLFATVIFSGFVAIVDFFYLRHKRKLHERANWFIELSRSLFPVLFIVFIVRSFVVEPFRLPSGSLEPTLLVGDFVLVNKYDFGLRLPILGAKIIENKHPKKGDIVVFHWPVDPSIDFIKRVVAVPGDRISYTNKTLYVNGVPATQRLESFAIDSDNAGNKWVVEKRQENLNGIKYNIYVIPSATTNDFKDLIVPKGKYFMMGDNRDNSDDSRDWGFVSEDDIVGKAFLIWFSWDQNQDTIRWQRLGKKIGGL